MSGWNPLVDPKNRHESPNQNARPGWAKVPTHVIIHITGTATTQPAHRRYMDKRANASPHYMIEKDGTLHQYVHDNRRAWHSGISRHMRPIYDRHNGDWRKYARFVRSHIGTWYPKNAIFLNTKLNPVPPSKAYFAAMPDGSDLPLYRYYANRWGILNDPIGYDHSASPNDYSIGIETVGYGGRKPNPNTYTEAMYETLADLIDNLSSTHGIARKEPFILGHEDVNPMDRYGWDPGQGFDWSRVHKD